MLSALAAVQTPVLASGRVRVVNHSALYTNGSLDIATHEPTPSFDPGDEALEHLRSEGYVVIRAVANASELEVAKRLLWEFVEKAGVGADRHAPSSWLNLLPNTFGIVWSHGVGQSQFMWYLRTRPRLLRAFARFWRTEPEDLISSFEGFSFFPPSQLEHEWSPLAESWFHTDQNAASRPGLQTIQSFISLWEQDESTGGFVVVPRSHLQHDAVTRRVYRSRPATPPEQQFLMIPPNDRVLTRGSAPRLVRVSAGDAVLWDSRVVHCNTPRLTAGETPPDADGAPRPARLVGYVSLAPRDKASETVLYERQQGFPEGLTCTHWPFDVSCLDTPTQRGEHISAPMLHPSQLVKALIGFPLEAKVDRDSAIARLRHSGEQKHELRRRLTSHRKRDRRKRDLRL